MKYKRMPIEAESPEELGYGTIECNLAESSVSDTNFKDLKFNIKDIPLCYGDHKGLPALRELLAADYNMKPEHIILVPGAAAGLFIVSTALLNKQSQLLVERPNYATNIETPRLLECEINFIDLHFEEQYQLDLYKLSTMAKSKPTLISITTPHNPTGSALSEEELLKVIELARKHNSYLLVDETYRDLSFNTPPPLAASLSDRVISVSSVSKAYGLPGIRMGWIACKNKRLLELFLAAKEQIFICNSLLDEHVALHYLQNKTKFFTPILKHIKKNFATLEKHMSKSKNLEWVKPKGGVVCYPRIIPKINYNQFYETLYNEHKTLVGAGHWFETDKKYMRIGFGWPTNEQLKQGLANIETTINGLKK
jgi:aspartate/methionine/tyrosine aminotransferase